MLNGKYKINQVDFSKLTSKKFSPHLYDILTHSTIGCGANALSLITGVPPHKFVKQNRRRNHYSDSFMIRNLRKSGFKVYTLNKCNLTNRETAVKYKIQDNHILLMSQLFLKKEASWTVSWNSLMFHNFEVSRLDPFSIINCPIVSAYIICKK
jgi:hypothetical protein